MSAAGWIVQSLDELNLPLVLSFVREMQSQGGPADYVLFCRWQAQFEAKKAGTTSLARRWSRASAIPPRRTGFPSDGPIRRPSPTSPPASRRILFETSATPDLLLAPGLRLSCPGISSNSSSSLTPFAPGSGSSPNWNTARSAIARSIYRRHQPRETLAANRPRAHPDGHRAGKTFTAVTQVHRLIKHAGAKRILLPRRPGQLPPDRQ
ncbi:MAG: hypothetical protein H7A54_10095 [Akkermansiaceae bacterium]|nr:hypothetical protein [Akkermansiaceae bacterium]